MKNDDLGAERLQVRIVGMVQGVGFRPFVFRLATELGLTGWVRNDGDGVTIEVEGAASYLPLFLKRLQQEKPKPAILYTFDHRFLPVAGFQEFKIVQSASEGPPRVWVLPDLATCPECRDEVRQPANRRYRYPFTNCTHCGPRFTIIEGLPYDRPKTSMRSFEQCPDCEREYRDPVNRRFHAQPNACPDCGPQTAFLDRSGRQLAVADRALAAAVELVREGKILALKGLGGYLLIADALSEEAVGRLRRRKERPHKAFAVMYPDLVQLKAHVEVPPYAEPLLLSPQAPIILLERTERGDAEIAPSVAPRSPYLGVFLPYTPLHILLLQDLHFPVVATSANLADEPIQYRDDRAIRKLPRFCDGFLVHDRPIVRPADDSVVQILKRPTARPQLLRRARGYAPLPVLAPHDLKPLLAVGGHLNSTLALSRGREIILSQHLGEMESYQARRLFEDTVRDFLELYQAAPKAIVHDLHPDYFTTRFAAGLAARMGVPCIPIQHHHAHLAACMIENQLEGSVLGFTWDGTGYGPDKTVWGGETLLGDAARTRRLASLHPFRLPGGERAVKEPWRVALALLVGSFGDSFPTDLPLFKEIPRAKIEAILQVLGKRTLSPVTTSMGRLFDGISALLGLSFLNTSQAQSAQLLEYAAWRGSGKSYPLPFSISEGEVFRLDWRELVRSLVEALSGGCNPDELAAGFHAALCRVAVELAERVGEPRVIMAGGCFCNRLLTESLLLELTKAGFQPHVHHQLPPTDGSLSVGQIWAADLL